MAGCEIRGVHAAWQRLAAYLLNIGGLKCRPCGNGNSGFKKNNGYGNDYLIARIVTVRSNRKNI